MVGRDDPLPTAQLEREIADVNWKFAFQSSGNELRSNLERLNDLWTAHREARSGVAFDFDEKADTGNGSTDEQIEVSNSAARVTDTETRTAVERHAVRRVSRELESIGFAVRDVGATKSWDLEATRGGAALRVEVKGSSTASRKVHLTRNEVQNAQSGEVDTALAIVSDIAVDADNNCSGGSLRVFLNWTPRDDDLAATDFDYLVPQGGSEDFSALS